MPSRVGRLGLGAGGHVIGEVPFERRALALVQEAGGAQAVTGTAMQAGTYQPQQGSLPNPPQPYGR